MKKAIITLIIKNRAASLKTILTIVTLLISAGLFAQSTTLLPADTSMSIFSNLLFDTLLCVIVLLLIIIIVLGSVLTNVASVTREKKNNNSGKIISSLLLLILISCTNNVFAQEVTKTNNLVQSSGYMGLSDTLFLSLLGFIVLEIIIISVLISIIQMLLKPEIESVNIEKKKETPSFLEIINASVSVEKEEEILLDHNYDGIRELDNDLPPWWKYGFYLTIAVAIIYLINFHVLKTGDLQLVEYTKSMEAAKEAKEAYQKMSANNVTENNVKLLTDKSEVEKGQAIFKDNCAVCHGKFGEGGVGPNLCDDNWLHGGGIVDIFKTIKYGWPDKGMKSWQADFSPVQINEIASYVKSFKGTNPANPKAPQGELYIETATFAIDSVKRDSTSISSLKDSLKTMKK